jgi:hypothetical protein
MYATYLMSDDMRQSTDGRIHSSEIRYSIFCGSLFPIPYTLYRLPSAFRLYRFAPANAG